MTAPRTPKEAVYDEHVHPLMAEIIRICKEHRINFVADFSLGYDPVADETLFCTTAMPNLDKGDEKGAERMMRAYHGMKPQSQVLAFTIFNGQKP